MPRIRAASIPEHVARQQQAVFDAAIRLFTEHGYSQVALGDIAAEVGLARNSLYRYYPDKAHILLQWYRQELPRRVVNSADLLTGDEPPVERIQRWALAQLDYARRPEHRLLAALRDIEAGLDDATRTELAESHRELLAPVAHAVAETGLSDPHDCEALSDFIGGVVLTVARQETAASENGPLRAAMLRAVAAVLDPTVRRAG